MDTTSQWEECQNRLVIWGMLGLSLKKQPWYLYPSLLALTVPPLPQLPIGSEPSYGIGLRDLIWQLALAAAPPCKMHPQHTAVFSQPKCLLSEDRGFG